MFRSKRVDGKFLLQLSQSDLRNELGIKEFDSKRIVTYIDDLKQSKTTSPLLFDQILFNNANMGNASDFQIRVDLTNLTPRALHLYRIWESMSGTPSASLHINPAADTMADVLRGALDAIRRRAADDGEVPDDASPRIVSREGITMTDVRRLPAKAFVLLVRAGDNAHRSEYYFFPSDVLGEKFRVPLLSAQRTVEVEVLAAAPRLVLVRDFLRPDECRAIRAAAEPLMKPSTVLQQGDQTKGEQQVVDNVRTSSTAWLMDRTVEVVKTVRTRVEELIKVPIDYAEDMQVLLYEVGQHYHVHHDYFDPALYPGDPRWASGHNRMLTVFFYLESVEQGGHTVFPFAGVDPATHPAIRDYGKCEEVDPKALRVPAVQGNAIIFYSMTARGQVAGELDKASLHGGCDPVKGDKWAANYWVRNGPVL